MSTCDVFNCLFPLDEIQLLSSLLFMASLFIGFLVERCVACQSRKSDFGWHRFRFFTLLDAHKRGLERKRSEEYLVINLAVERKL